MLPEVEIPSCILEFSGFVDLTEYEKSVFVGRLNYFLDLGKELHEEDRVKSAENFSDFLENLELDLAARQSLTGQCNNTVSSWIIHNSWMSDAIQTDKAFYLDNFAKTLLNKSEPSVNESLEGLTTWFRNSGKDLLRLLEIFSEAKNLLQGLSIYISIDTLVLRILLCCYKTRLNPCIYVSNN